MEGIVVIACSFSVVVRMVTIPTPNSTACTIMKTIAAICSRVHMADLPRFAQETVAGPALILLGPQFRARAKTASEDERERCRDQPGEATG